MAVVDQVHSADLHMRTRPDAHRATYCSPSNPLPEPLRECEGSGAYVRAEVIENPKEIPIEIDSHELMQAPGFRLRCGQQSGVAGAPLSIEFVNFLHAVQIQPGQRGSNVAEFLPCLLVRQEHAAVRSGDPRAPDVL